MKQINWWKTNFNNKDRDKLIQAFNKRYISMNQIATSFEKKLAKKLNVKYSILTNSGTSALTMSLMCLGIKNEDEVLVPSLTWIATANAVAVLGAKAILVDCNERGLINTSKLEQYITKNTKAIIPVHLNGKSCNIDKLSEIAKKYNLHIIEDSCKAFLSKNKTSYIGTKGTLGCFSFGMISLLPMGYGGMIVTNNKNLYKKLQIIRSQGAKYKNNYEESYLHLGSNFKVSDLLISLAESQFERVDKKIKKLNKIYSLYEKGLKELMNISIFPCNIENGEIPLCAEVLCEKKDSFRLFMKNNNIDILPFHLPLHKANYFKNENKNLEKANKISQKGLIIPSGPGQKLKDIKYCIAKIKEWDYLINEGKL